MAKDRQGAEASRTTPPGTAPSTTTMRATRRRLSPEEREHRNREALARAEGTTSVLNAVIVVNEFSARGLSDVRPGDNVLTFNAWKARRRHVRKGQHGVKITVWAPTTRTDKTTGEESEGKRPVTAVVFHVSQTDPDEALENGRGNASDHHHRARRTFTEARHAAETIREEESPEERRRRDAALDAQDDAFTTPRERPSDSDEQAGFTFGGWINR